MQTLSIELIKAIPFLVIGGITAYIAYRQYKIEKTRLKSELYERKFKIYKQINNVLFLYLMNKPLDERTYLVFSESILQWHFTFSGKINKKIDDFESLILDHLEQKPKGNENSKIIRFKIIALTRNILDDIATEAKIQ